jgi:hypothetical protein
MVDFLKGIFKADLMPLKLELAPNNPELITLANMFVLLLVFIF